MSGDVQPRKRKDKKKKKDEPVLPPFVYVKEEPSAPAGGRDGGGGSPAAPASDELIHVYKESRLGGNICAKIVFFLLLGTLAVMVGLIITEHRGSSEVATAADSPWSQMLEGWIDDSPPDKHDDEHDAVADSGEHDEHDEHDDDGHDEEHDEEQDEDHDEEHDDEHDEEHDEDHDESGVVEQEQIARAARSVASESKVSEEEEDEGADEDNQEEEEQEEEDGNEDGGEDEEEEEEEGADEENQEDEGQDGAVSQEDENEPEESDDPSEPEGQEGQELPQSAEETSQFNEEEEQDENDDKFVFKEIPGVTASAEDLDGTDDNTQGDVDQDEEDDISEYAGKFSDAGYYSAHEDNDDNDDDGGDDGDDVENNYNNSDGEDEDNDNNDDGDEDEDGEGDEDTDGDNESKDNELEKNNSEENEEDEDEINLSRNADNSNEIDENSFHMRGDQDPENEDMEDEKEGEDDSDDPDGGFDEPLDNDGDVNDNSRNFDEYEEIERDFDSLGTSPQRDDVSTEQHMESDDDFEEISDVPESTESEKDKEEESLEPIAHIGQPHPESDQEISDGEEILGSEDEGPPPPTVARRTGGPKDVNEFLEWPMGPDYPPEKPPTPTIPTRETHNLHSMEAQIEENPEATLKEVKRLLESNPEEVALLSLQAQALDKLAEMKHSNKLLEEAIKCYLSLLNMKNLSDNLFLKIANRTINRMRFRGQYGQAIGVHKMLISRFPQDPAYRNDLAVSYLMVGRVSSAKLVLEEILHLWPSNGFALVHYGFILKTSENDNEGGSRFLQAGIDSGEPGTMDARFLFHLGDAYNRLGKNIQAQKVYELGVEKGLFRSKYQRSLYNVDRLTAHPWWTLQQTTYEKQLRKFEEHWKEIRDEGLSILEAHGKTSAFKDEAENLRDKGVWRQLELYARGQQIPSNCKRAPVTCQLISKFPAAHTCRRGQAKFSVMHPDTHVWPHCGPTNCRLRAHLGLVVPSGTALRVGEEIRSWQEGKMFVFDDSFEHEVWHNGSSLRLVLILDIWHPELTDYEKRSLPAI